MDTLNDFKYTMDSCNHCGQCKWLLSPKSKGWDFAEICPIYQLYGFDAYSGQGMINIAKEVMNGKLEYGDGLEEMLYSCTTCGACDVNCKNVRDMEVLDTILALRADCAERGTLPDPIRETAEHIEETHNIYGLPAEKRFAWLTEEIPEESDCDTVLFIGCAAAYRHPEIALAAIRILQAGGIRFRLLREEEWCCGSFLWRTGQTEKAEKLIRRNVELFHNKGIKTIITACAECFGAFRSGYPRFLETQFTVRHISEVAAELLKEGRLSVSRTHDPLRVAFHDPCMLGRQSEPYTHWEGEIRPFGLHVPEKQWRRGEKGVYEPPREVLRALPGIELVEMPRNYEESYCCGAGGGASAVHPELNKWAAGERRREAASVGADAIVSGCPFCQDSFEQLGDHPMPYLDLTVLLAGML